MALNVGELVAYLRLDMGDFDKGMSSAQARADKLDGKDVDVKVKADSAVAEEKIAAITAAADKLGFRDPVDVKVTANTSKAEAKFAEAVAAADKLDAKDVDIKVKADTAVAEAKLAAVAASEDKVDAGNKKIAKSGQDAGRGMGAIVAAVLLLGPALVPIVQATVGLGFGLGAMGVAGVLALVGIVQEIGKGTALGGQFSAMLVTLKGDLTTLGHAAALGVLGPFQQAVADLQTKMPALNGLIGEFSVITGKTAGVLINGLVSAMIMLAPLGRDASVYILTLTQRFAGLMSGQGVVAFGDYVRSVFPQVMQAIGSLASAVGHLLNAIAPLGLGSLTILRMLSDVILAIPVNVLATLAQLASSVYIGFKLFGLLSGGITALGTALGFVGASAGKVAAVSGALQAVGISAETAAAGVRSLTIAAGVIGAILAVATLVYSAFADSTRANTQAANDFADALRQDNGALGENTRQMVANQLQKADALTAANQLGISLPLLTDAVLGNADAMAKVAAITDAATNNYQDSSAAAQNRAIAADKVSKAVGTENAQLQDGVQKYKDLTAATATSTTTAVTPFTAAQDALAAKIGTTSAALVTAAAGQQTTAKAAQDAAAKMWIENDAAGILKGSLDLLNGKALSLMQAQTADAAATNSATAALKANGKAIDGTSDAAIKNQQALQSKALASQAEAEAVGKATGSTEAAVKAYGESKAALEASLKAQGLLTPAVQAYIDKLYQVSNVKVAPTPLDVDKAEAEAKVAAFQALVNGTHGATVVLSVTAAFDATVAAVLAGQRANIKLNLPGHAAGGMIAGLGSGTSDSILGVNANGVPITRVSPGEFVVNAAATARNRAQLDAINSGQQVGAGSGSPNGPTTFNLYDANNVLLGTMHGVATNAIGAQAREASYGGY